MTKQTAYPIKARKNSFTSNLKDTGCAFFLRIDSKQTKIQLDLDLECTVSRLDNCGLQ
jgi:hypothetical protein